MKVKETKRRLKAMKRQQIKRYHLDLVIPKAVLLQGQVNAVRMVQALFLFSLYSTVAFLVLRVLKDLYTFEFAPPHILYPTSITILVLYSASFLLNLLAEYLILKNNLLDPIGDLLKRVKFGI